MAASSKVEVVTDIRRCQQIVEDLEKCNIVAVDCEGVNLGKDGPLTLLQIATPDGMVYLFDIFTNKRLFDNGKLRDILRSSRIVKVIHSCSGDSAALYWQFNIKLENVFDTQIAHLVIEEHNGKKLPSPAKLADLCKLYSDAAHVSEQKESLKDKFVKEDAKFWCKRPLTEEMIDYVAGDVTAIISDVYENQKRLIDTNSLNSEFNTRVKEEINYYIDDTLPQRRQERVDAKVNQILSEFRYKYGSNTKLADITDENDLRALQNTRYDNPSFTPLIARLKAEEMKACLKKVRDQLTEEGDAFIPKVRSYAFLRAYQFHPDIDIQREAKQLFQRLNDIFKKDMSAKYTTTTEYKTLRQYEKDALQTLRPSSASDRSVHSVLLSLYWQKQEDDLEKTIADFRRLGSSYAIPTGKYKWIRYNVSGDVPRNLKLKAKNHLDNLDKMFGKGKCPQT